MSLRRAFGLFASAALFVVACGPGATPTLAPTTAPSAVPSASASLDPGTSDAGVVGVATVSGDQRGQRDGTYQIAGLAADGSSCDTSFEGDEFLVSAVNESVAKGQIRSMFVNVPTTSLPTQDGQTSEPITTDRAGFDFASDAFGGTLYVGEPADDDRTTMSITVSQTGSDLVFAFSGTTWDGIAISGQMVCADAA